MPAGCQILMTALGRNIKAQTLSNEVHTPPLPLRKTETETERKRETEGEGEREEC